MFRTVPYGFVSGKRRLGKDDWTAAALVALAEGGPSAVAVEPLAVKLGATKGSAYWHFPNREALLRATLERWERENTEAVIELADTEVDAMGRLRTLFSAVLGPVFESTGGGRVELRLFAAPGAAEDPVIGPVVHRVTERRIGYIAGLLRELGFTEPEARRRAVLAYTVYLGNAQLRHGGPSVLPEGRAERGAYVMDALNALTRKP
jgi:AcrR family transcriptional regulator